MNDFEFLRILRTLLVGRANEKDQFLVDQFDESLSNNNYGTFFLSLYYLDQNKTTVELKTKAKEFIIHKLSDLSPNPESAEFLKYLCYIEPIFPDSERDEIFNAYSNIITTSPEFYKFRFVPIIAEYLEGYHYRKVLKEVRRKMQEKYSVTSERFLSSPTCVFHAIWTVIPVETGHSVR